MKKFINSFLFIVVFLQTGDQTCNDSEFIVQKKIILTNNDSSTKTKEKIVRTSGDILKLDTELAKLSVDIRALLLDEVEACLENSKDGFVSKASKQELKNALSELNSFKIKLEENIKIVKKNLTSLQKKFCSE